MNRVPYHVTHRGGPQRRALSTIGLIAAIVVVAVVAVFVVLLTAPPGPRTLDPEQAQEQVEALSQKLSLAIQNKRDTAALLGPAQTLARKFEGYPPAHTLYGQVLMHNGRLEPAAAQLRETLRLEAENAEAYALLGAVCVRLGDYDAARTNFQRAIRLDQDNPEHRVKLANVEFLTGDDVAAERVALDSLKLNSNTHQAYALLSQIFEKRGKPGLAQQQMVKAMETAPGEDLETRITYIRRRAAMLRRANRPADALAVLRELPREDLFTMDVAEDMARTYGMMSQPALAAVHYETMVDLDPTNDDAAALAAGWYLKAGDNPAAQNMVTKLVRINPRHPSLPELQKKLGS